MDVLKIICVMLVFITVSKCCTDTSECDNKCTDGYHAQCEDSTCKCPKHTCDAVTKCPQGAGSGCPPFCATSCNRGVCLCKCNGTK